jgi:hypothetical protein
MKKGDKVLCFGFGQCVFIDLFYEYVIVQTEEHGEQYIPNYLVKEDGE